MRELDRPSDIPRFHPFDPLGDMIVQRTGPFAHRVLAAGKAAVGFPLRLRRTERQIDFVEITRPRLRGELIWLPARRRSCQLLAFATCSGHARRPGLPRLGLMARRAHLPGAGQLVQVIGGHQRQGIRRAVRHTGGPLRALKAEIALLGGSRQRCGDNLDGAKRAGNHTGFTADTFVLLHLYTVMHAADSPVRAALDAGGVFTVVAGYGALFIALFDHGDARGKMALAEDMLLIIMCHDASDLAGIASNTLLAICHNKTVHDGSLAGPDNLILLTE